MAICGVRSHECGDQRSRSRYSGGQRSLESDTPKPCSKHLHSLAPCSPQIVFFQANIYKHDFIAVFVADGHSYDSKKRFFFYMSTSSSKGTNVNNSVFMAKEIHVAKLTGIGFHLTCMQCFY